MTKKTINQILMDKGYNFGQRMNMIRRMKAGKKEKKQTRTMKAMMSFFDRK